MRLRNIFYFKKYRIKQSEPAFICSHIAKKTKPILYVCKEGGDWQFLCGEEHENEIPVVVCLGHMFNEDKTLIDIIDLENDWEATRESIGQKWIRSKIINSSSPLSEGFAK